MKEYNTHKFPRSRIATSDVCAIGIRKHHIVALIEIDVTLSKEKITEFKRRNANISFTAWLISVISITIKEYKHVTAYLHGRQKIIVFEDIDVSLLVEKDINGIKVPIPLLIKKAQKQNIESIATQIKEAKEQTLTDKDILLKNKSSRYERLYYYLPGILRRKFWRYLLKHPQTAFKKMGNVGITSIGTKGKANGWFIPISIHPVCFGIGNITKKPWVINDKIEVREILNMTVLLDHDVIDGGDMARFISQLSDNIETGMGLEDR